MRPGARSSRAVVQTGRATAFIILEDSDNDGTADKRTVFVDGLNLATGILLGHGGALIGQAPNLFFFRDSDGDDKADEFKTVLTGFGLEDRHELLNGFCWGPDGQLYFTHGVFTHSKVRRPAEPTENGFTINAGVFRVRFGAGTESSPGRFEPVAFRYEVFADGTSNPWGVDFDANGNAFVSACVIDHLFHMAPGGLYQRQGGSPEYPYAYELLPSIVGHKHFRAAYAGLQVYQGGVYPADTHGHIFIGNIHDNAIHEEKVEPVGATFKACSGARFPPRQRRLVPSRQHADRTRRQPLGHGLVRQISVLSERPGQPRRCRPRARAHLAHRSPWWRFATSVPARDRNCQRRRFQTSATGLASGTRDGFREAHPRTTHRKAR